jgi:hypothetical protein
MDSAWSMDVQMWNMYKILLRNMMGRDNVGELYTLTGEYETYLNPLKSENHLNNI